MNENTREILRQKGYVLGPNGYFKPDKVVVAGPCASITESPVGNRSLGKSEDKESRPARRLLRFTAFRTRLLDDDNNIFKYECDALRYAKIILNDGPAQVEISAKQIKVKNKSEVGTLIEIEELCSP